MTLLSERTWPDDTNTTDLIGASLFDILEYIMRFFKLIHWPWHLIALAICSRARRIRWVGLVFLGLYKVLMWVHFGSGIGAPGAYSAHTITEVQNWECFFFSPIHLVAVIAFLVHYQSTLVWIPNHLTCKTLNSIGWSPALRWEIMSAKELYWGQNFTYYANQVSILLFPSTSWFYGSR